MRNWRGPFGPLPCVLVVAAQFLVCLKAGPRNGYITISALQDSLRTGVDVTFPARALDNASTRQTGDVGSGAFDVVVLKVFQSAGGIASIAIITVWTEDNFVPHDVTDVNSSYHLVYGHVSVFLLAEYHLSLAALEDAHAAESVRSSVLEHVLGVHPAFGTQTPQ